LSAFTRSTASIVGLIPLAISQEMWLPLSVTVIGGLVVVTFLALLIVPCLYLLLSGERAPAGQLKREAEGAY